MSHVDEGQLEAWIDRDRSGMSVAEAEAIAHHLESCVACSSLLAEVTRLRERASSILGGAHLDDRRIPDFEQVRARAGAVAGGAKAPPRPARSPLVAYAWAASLIVAIGLGWLTRDLLGPRPVANQADSGLMREVAVQPVEVEADEAPAGEVGEEERVALAPSAPSPPPSAQAPTSSPTPSSAPTSSSARAGVPTDSAIVTLSLVQFDAAARSGSEEVPVGEAPASEPGRNTASEAAPGADRTGVVAQGQVVDPSGAPLSGATVSIGSDLRRLTDSEGRFSLPIPAEQLAEGEDVPLTVQLLGYSGRTLALADTGSDTITAQIELAPAMLALSEIVVVGYGESREPGSTASRSMIPVAAGPAAEVLEGAGAPRAPTPPVLLQSVSGASMTMNEASRRLGSPVVSIPGLEVLSVEMMGNAAAPTVQIRQRLPEGGTLLLLQSAEPLSDSISNAPTDNATSQVRRGSLYITGIAPISVEALQRLLDTAQ